MKVKMNKYMYCLAIILNITIAVAAQDNCAQCVRSDNCPYFQNMNRKEQRNWLSQYRCRQQTREEFIYFYDFRPTTKIDYVCCPNNYPQYAPPIRPADRQARMNSGAQCEAVTILPPDPNTGCCGIDTFGTQGVADAQTMVSGPRNSMFFMGNNARMKRQTDVVVELDNRIAGGSETELNQFPWTILLRATFNDGNNETSFECGGSIISSLYILTAAHCVVTEGAVLTSVNIFLAEYDKRTFPTDCKISSNGVRSCINNMVIPAEKVIPHFAYNRGNLYNDIALIRLREPAPYTEFMRPICLAPINLNSEVFHGVSLPVAGWGRNGPYVSNIKQSTVLNLVSQNQCLRYYPYLQSSHLCAIGQTGEDTCKGDSGGPLMMLYGGRYYVVGVVSGKRADVPCGSAVPSLFTNVYQYYDWIRNNID